MSLATKDLFRMNCGTLSGACYCGGIQDSAGPSLVAATYSDENKSQQLLARVRGGASERGFSRFLEVELIHLYIYAGSSGIAMIALPNGAFETRPLAVS